MSYISQRARVKSFFEKKLMPALINKDLPYKEVINLACAELGVSESLVETVLESFINSKRINEIRILTIPDEDIVNWLGDINEREKLAKEQQIQTIESIDKAEEALKDIGTPTN